MNCPHCNTSVDEHEAGRCLDAWVAEAVMGWEFLRIGYTGEHKGADAETPRQVELEKAGWLDEVGLTSVGSYYIDEPNHKWITLKGDWMHENVWSPSTDIAAAWEVVGRVNKGGHIVEIVNDMVAWSVTFIHVDELEKKYTSDWKVSLPTQICRVALKSVIREEQREPV